MKTIVDQRQTGVTKPDKTQRTCLILPFVCMCLQAVDWSLKIINYKWKIKLLNIFLNTDLTPKADVNYKKLTEFERMLIECMLII